MTPLSPEEILKLLPRLAATDKRAAIRLALYHPKVHFTYGYVRPNGTRSWHYSSPGFDFVNGKDGLRITISRPPKRRALRRDELPDKVFFLPAGHFVPPEPASRMGQESINHFAYSGYEVRWSHDKDGPWHPFYIDEPQEPLVISTEEN